MSGPARAGDVRLVGRAQQVGDRLERAACVEVGDHQRASMSAVTPGIVAPRAPASVARLRALVCDSDGRVGAMNTSHAANAAATAAAARCRRSRVRPSPRARRRPKPPRPPRAALLRSRGCGVDDDQHVFAGLHGQAAVDDRARLLVEGRPWAADDMPVAAMSVAARPLRQRAVARAPAPSDARLARPSPESLSRLEQRNHNPRVGGSSPSSGIQLGDPRRYCTRTNDSGQERVAAACSSNH